ncbi:MAG: permease [Fimbriiglobus sp.]
MELAFWSFVLRFGQASLDATLTLIIGVVTAGILRRMVGPSGTRRLFGSGFRGLASGWLAGMLLPVCALGVIPVAREMRRCGVPGGTVLAFVLAAPLLNPISFLYGLTLAEPTVILCFAGFSLILSTAAGFLWDQVFATAEDRAATVDLAQRADAEPAPPVGLQRILSVFVTAAKELSGRDLLYYVIGLSGTALLSAAIPYGALQHTMHHSNKLSPLLMTALAIPLFSSPLPGMMKIGLMFDHGNSIGAAFVLFAIGIGTSLGTIVWLLRDYGWRRALPWFLTYVVIVVGMGYACEALLYDHRKAELDHTHAFDDYSQAFPGGSECLADMTMKKLQEKFGPLERPATYGFLAMMSLGLLLRRLDVNGRVEGWLTRPPVPTKASKLDVKVPGPVLGILTLVGLVVFSVIGAYVYYPDREQCMDQMFAVYADASTAVRSGKTEEAIRHLELWDQLVRKLEVGTYLRNFVVTPEQAKSAENLREAIEAVRDELIAKDSEAAKAVFKAQIQAAYDQCKTAYNK